MTAGIFNLRAACGAEAPDIFPRDTADLAVAVFEKSAYGNDISCGAGAAEKAEALDKRGPGSVTRRGDSRRPAGRSAAAYNDVIVADNGDFPCYGDILHFAFASIMSEIRAMAT